MYAFVCMVVPTPVRVLRVVYRYLRQCRSFLYDLTVATFFAEKCCGNAGDLCQLYGCVVAISCYYRDSDFSLDVA